MQGELAKIGINLIIKGEEEQAFRDRMKSGDFDFTFNPSKFEIPLERMSLE